MAIVRPFRGIRYAATVGRDVSDLIAPPYDVLDAADKASLLGKSPYNIVAVDLPHVPPKTLGPDSAYASAAQTMKLWLDRGVLVRDSRPAFYPYEQSYTHEGKSYARRGLVGLVKLTPFGVDVIPHERTYPGPIEDRLRLMQTTTAQLSAVFGLYRDPSNEITRLLFSHTSMPDAVATLDGVTHKLWDVIDAAVDQRVVDLFADKKIYIADGHHRYTTALHYQRLAEQEHGGPLPEDHPANYAMFVLVGFDDPGLIVLPTHRLIGGVANWSADAFVALASRHLDITPTPYQTQHLPEVAGMLGGFGAGVIAMFDRATGRVWKLALRDSAIMKQLEPNQSDAWRSLDVAVLRRLVIDELIVGKMNAGNDAKLAYTPDASQIAPKLRAESLDVAFLLQSTPVTALADLGDHGEVMPQKSTYFYPKPATGLVINALGEER
jgi:uncharacterized protein (DUF1015 family)